MRLILLLLEIGDSEPFAEMNSNKTSWDISQRFCRQKNKCLCGSHNAEFDETGIGLYAVEIKESGEFIGYVGFYRFNFDTSFSPGWEIGWRISDRFWHKGYATEAAKACLNYARKKHFCDILYSFTAVQNTPSENVMKRIGMTCEGIFLHPALPDGHWLKEHKLYSIDL